MVSQAPRIGELGSDCGSTIIIGAGLAGLSAAVKSKAEFPQVDVVVIEKPHPESNSLLAGQRYRAGISGQHQDGVQEISSLMASRNSGVTTPEMIKFAELAAQELNYWLGLPGFVEHEDRRDWFGPRIGAPNQSGKGRGRSVLEWYRKAAENLGVRFERGEVQKLIVEDGHVDGLVVDAGASNFYRLAATDYVLANGSIGGQMFSSTNKKIALSAHELAFEAGLDLADSTVHMLHPFGNCDPYGNQKPGCFETDELSDAKVYLDGLSSRPLFDPETTELLQNNQAHYLFPEIVKKFREFGSVVLLEFADGNHKFARVSHHQAHIGIATTDGISVEGTDNLFALGDASGLGYWTNHRERFPGFGLLKCLVDAELLVGRLRQSQVVRPNSVLSRPEPLYEPRLDKKQHSQSERAIRDINSQHLHLWLGQTSLMSVSRGSTGEAWVDSLLTIAPEAKGSCLLDISLAAAEAHRLIGLNEVDEPFRLNQQLSERILASYAKV